MSSCGQHLWKGRKQDWTKQKAEHDAVPISVSVNDSSELYQVVCRGPNLVIIHIP